MNLEAKLKQLLEERENLLVEMDEIQKAYNLRQQRLIELVGAIKTVQELLGHTDVASTMMYTQMAHLDEKNGHNNVNL